MTEMQRDRTGTLAFCPLPLAVASCAYVVRQNGCRQNVNVNHRRCSKPLPNRLQTQYESAQMLMTNGLFLVVRYCVDEILVRLADVVKKGSKPHVQQKNIEPTGIVQLKKPLPRLSKTALWRKKRQGRSFGVEQVTIQWKGPARSWGFGGELVHSITGVFAAQIFRLPCVGVRPRRVTGPQWRHRHPSPPGRPRIQRSYGCPRA